MIASKKIERQAKSSARLTVSVGKTDVRAAYDDLLKDYGKTVRIDGFRQGKVPAAVLERKFGDALKTEAMARLMDAAVQDALEGEELVPLAYAQPSLEGEPSFDLDSDFSFSVTYDVFPEVKPGDVSGAEVEVPAVSVSKADEERELAEIRERNALVKDKDEGSRAAKGDIVTVNYVELDDAGQPVQGTERQDFVFEIGSGYNLYKFDDDFVGMKKGDEKVVDKTFPADFEYSELAGASRKLKLSLVKLKEKTLPELDDDLAQDVSEKFKTLDDLKADIRAKLEKRLDDRLRSIKEKGIIDALRERSEVDVPESMVQAELDMRMRNLMQRMGLDNEERLAQIIAASGRTAQSMYDEWRPDAEKAIKTRLVLDKMVADGAFEATDADMDAEYAKMAAESSMGADDIKAEYEKRGMVDYLRDRIKEDKLLAQLADKVKVKKGKKMAFVDLFKENE
ncbi:MAG: trigger factor [Spirochaetales bacterium]|nr:trigger factor [Spirochaetales bacterium]